MVIGETLTTASNGRAVITSIWMVAGSGSIRSVLVCDDRPAVLHGLSDMLRPLPGLVEIAWVTNGFELVDVFAARPVDLVLIGVHGANSAGAEAVSLLLGMYPATVIIVFGSVTEIDVLAGAYVRGARGMLPWDPERPGHGTVKDDPMPG